MDKKLEIDPLFTPTLLQREIAKQGPGRMKKHLTKNVGRPKKAREEENQIELHVKTNSEQTTKNVMISNKVDNGPFLNDVIPICEVLIENENNTTSEEITTNIVPYSPTQSRITSDLSDNEADNNHNTRKEIERELGLK